MPCNVALFGAAEKGRFRHLYQFDTLLSLAETLGNPPPDTQGMTLAIQALLLDKTLYFIRVEEEGLSKKDYMKGLSLLGKTSIAALCIPGACDQSILGATIQFCTKKSALLITTEKDFYDFITTASPM